MGLADYKMLRYSKWEGRMDTVKSAEGERKLG